MKDTPSSISTINETTNLISQNDEMNATKDHNICAQNDENKNIILFDDDNNQNVLSTTPPATIQSNCLNNKTSLHQTPKKYVEDELTKSTNDIINDADNTNEIATSQIETPLPDWIVLNESILIRPYNMSGVISFIGPTHFSVSWKQSSIQKIIF